MLIATRRFTLAVLFAAASTTPAEAQQEPRPPAPVMDPYLTPERVRRFAAGARAAMRARHAWFADRQDAVHRCEPPTPPTAADSNQTQPDYLRIATRASGMDEREFALVAERLIVWGFFGRFATETTVRTPHQP